MRREGLSPFAVLKRAALDVGADDVAQTQFRIAFTNQFADAVRQAIQGQLERGVQPFGMQLLNGLLADKRSRRLIRASSRAVGGEDADIDTASATDDLPAAKFSPLRLVRSGQQNAIVQNRDTVSGGYIQFQKGDGTGRYLQMKLQSFPAGLGSRRPVQGHRALAGRLHEQGGNLAVEGGNQRVAILEARLPQGEIERFQVQQSRPRSLVNELPLSFADKALFLQRGMVSRFHQTRRFLAADCPCRALDQRIELGQRQAHQHAFLDALQLLLQAFRREEQPPELRQFLALFRATNRKDKETRRQGDKEKQGHRNTCQRDGAREGTGAGPAPTTNRSHCAPSYHEASPCLLVSLSPCLPVSLSVS